MNCPIKKDTCPCEEFSKEGLCDYPYPVGATFEQIQTITITEYEKEQ